MDAATLPLYVGLLSPHATLSLSAISLSWSLVISLSLSLSCPEKGRGNIDSQELGKG